MARPHPVEPSPTHLRRGPFVSGLCILAALVLGGLLYSSIAIVGKDRGNETHRAADNSVSITEQYKQQYKQSIATFLMSVAVSHANGVMAELDRGLAWTAAGAQKDYTQVASTIDADTNFTESYKEFNQHLDKVDSSFAAIPNTPDASYQYFTDTAKEIKSLHDAYIHTLTQPAGTFHSHDADLKEAEDALMLRLHEAINRATAEWPELADTPATAA